MMIHLYELSTIHEFLKIFLFLHTTWIYYNIFLLEKRFNQPYTTWISNKPALIQRGSSGPNIQPHTTAAYHDRGGQTHGFYQFWPLILLSPSLIWVSPWFHPHSPRLFQPREQYWTWFADESKPRIVIFVILLIEISLNFEDQILKSEFW